MPDKVLIVDDEPDILNLARLILEKNGFRVVTASDGQEALARALPVYSQKEKASQLHHSLGRETWTPKKTSADPSFFLPWKPCSPSYTHTSHQLVGKIRCSYVNDTFLVFS